MKYRVCAEATFTSGERTLIDTNWWVIAWFFAVFWAMTHPRSIALLKRREAEAPLPTNGGKAP